LTVIKSAAFLQAHLFHSTINSPGMKKLLLLLLVYANMGFTAADKGFKPSETTSLPPVVANPGTGHFIVSSPDACRVVMN